MLSESVFPDAVRIPLYMVPRHDDSRLYRDLCSTCEHQGACAGLSTAEHPIFFCEEFEICTPYPPPRLAPPTPARTPKKPTAIKRTGLCMNCDNRRTCALSRPEGGVWRCEEYR